MATDFSPVRRRLAERLGADIVADPDGGPYSTWAKLAGTPLPPSPLWDAQLRARAAIFECVGTQGMLQAVIDAALPHSRIVVVGVCQQPDTLTPVRAITKELTMRFVFAYRPGEFGQALDRIAGGSVDVSALSTATLNLDRADEAFDALRPPSEQCKIVLSP